MRKKFISLIVLLVALLFGGMMVTDAADYLPDSFVSDGIREVTYLENFPVIVKTADNGKYYIYCMDMSARYDGGVTFSKTGTVDPGFTYILNNKPNTGDKDKDFYITQMAVWYYEDYLNNNNFNLVSEVKKYIIHHRDTEEVSNKIYYLYEGAKNYKEVVGQLALGRDDIIFTEQDEYFVSSEIKFTTKGIDSVKYSLSGAPVGSQIVKKDNGNLVVRVPKNKITEGKEIVVTLKVVGNYNQYTGYYYYNSSRYQRLLFQDNVVTPKEAKDEIKMVVANIPNNHKVKISKTDVTETNEVAGATLVVKDEAGKVIEEWVSSTTHHEITLPSGKYTLTETIAPAGYRLSQTTISFMVDSRGSVYVKTNDGKYSAVDKVIMINELQDVVGIRKLDKDSKAYVAGAKLQVKDNSGKVVREFVTTNKIYYVELDPGYYTLTETAAPSGYILSNEVIYFYLGEDGTIKVKNELGEYVDSAYVTFYNTKEKKQKVVVPPTSSNKTLLIVSGIALLIGGVYYAKKTIKEC